MTPTNLPEAVAEVIGSFGDNDLTPILVADRVDRQYPEIVADALQERRRDMIAREARKQLRPRSDPPLPGFDVLPERITVPADSAGAVIWRSTKMATRDDFEAHLAMLDAQIEADRQRRDGFEDEMRRVFDLFDQYGVDRIIDLPTI